MRTALISDIHSNLPALETVLADIDRRGVDRIVCLGDIVGYGPDPIECVDLVAARCEWSLMGNHDFGVLYEPTNFNSAAELVALDAGDLEAHLRRPDRPDVAAGTSADDDEVEVLGVAHGTFAPAGGAHQGVPRGAASYRSRSRGSGASLEAAEGSASIRPLPWSHACGRR